MRKQRRMPEQWEADYAEFGGGLDQTSGPLKIKPGRLAQALNVEEVFGQQGYDSIRGYERYSGKPSPSACNYAVQPFDTGSIAIAAGDTVTNATTATALVVSVTLSTGSWAGGDAAGYLIVTSLASSWANNDAIKVGGVQRALASDITEVGSVGYSGHQAALKAAREALRALIAKPAGEGAILGVAVFNQAVYCVRNIVGSASATLWKSTASGWSSIQTGLHPDGAYKFEVANFSGASTTKALFGVSGRTRLFKVTSAGVFSYADPIYGSEALSTSAVLVGTGPKTFTSATASRNWVAGDALTSWDYTNTANYMTGTVTSYNSGTGALVMNITSVGGSGTISTWEIGLTNYNDKPFLLGEHKDHLFLAYPLGQLQSSNLGDPMVYTTTATLFGIGDELTGITSLKGEVLGIFARQKIKLLRGTSSLDWVLGNHTKDVGGVAGTIQDNSGNAIFLDDKGLTCLQSTQSFGDFSASILSANAKTTLDAMRTSVIGSRMAKNNYQYRLYFSDGSGLRCTILTGNPEIRPQDVSFTPFAYTAIPTCFAGGTLSDGLEHMFFGTSDGYVMEEDAGTSYDGVAYYRSLRLPYNHCKRPGAEKRFHKMEIEMACLDAVTINYRQLFDYDDGTYGQGGTQTMAVTPAGGLFDVAEFDTFTFDAPAVSRAEASINGVGRNMSLLIFFEDDFARPVSMQSLTTYFSQLRLTR